MDRKKLDTLRAKYADDAPGASHHPEFKRAIETIFAGTDRRPKPYEGVATFLGAPFCPDAPQQADFGGLDVALVGVPMDLGVTNRPGARFGPRAVRGVERIGPYHHVHRFLPLSAVKAGDVGDVPFRSRYSLDDSIEDIEAFFTRVAAAGVTPLAVGGDHSISYPILKALGAKRPVGHGAYRRPLRHGRALRGRQVPPRRPVPPGGACRRARSGAHHPDRHSRRRRIPVGVLLRQRHDRHPRGGVRAPRRCEDNQEDPRGRRQRPDLHLLRCRQPRSRLRARHRHARRRAA